MQEVTIRLRFTTACLGHINRNVSGRNVYEMPRDHAGRVMFFASRWRQELEFAAKLASSSDSFIRNINWSLHIDGSVTRWRRYLPDTRNRKRVHKPYAMHEAFQPGAVIGVTAVLPTGLELLKFRELLELVGTYRGISPFRCDGESYGLFDVVSVLPAKRATRIERSENYADGDDTEKRDRD